MDAGCRNEKCQNLCSGNNLLTWAAYKNIVLNNRLKV